MTFFEHTVALEQIQVRTLLATWYWQSQWRVYHAVHRSAVDREDGDDKSFECTRAAGDVASVQAPLKRGRQETHEGNVYHSSEH